MSKPLTFSDLKNAVIFEGSLHDDQKVSNCIITQYMKFCKERGLPDLDGVLDSVGQDGWKLGVQFEKEEDAIMFKMLHG